MRTSSPFRRVSVLESGEEHILEVPVPVPRVIFLRVSISYLMGDDVRRKCNSTDKAWSELGVYRWMLTPASQPASIVMLVCSKYLPTLGRYLVGSRVR